MNQDKRQYRKGLFTQQCPYWVKVVLFWTPDFQCVDKNSWNILS